MNKTIVFIIACTVGLMATLTATAIAAIPNSTTTGTCFDGSQWTLGLSRKGDKVTSYLTVKPTLKNADWVVNYAYNPAYSVSHKFVKSNGKGVLTTSETVYSHNKVGVLIFTDNKGTMYCVAYGEI